MIILGVDPGLASTGFGAIDCDGKTPVVISFGHIKTLPGNSVASRLFQIHNDMEEIIDKTRPDIVAIENVFSLVRYPKAGILLGGVLGALYVTVQRHGTALVEISTKEVKNALVGFGSANKDQVKEAVQRLLRVSNVKSFHASDALAVALTAWYRSGSEKKRL